MKRKVAVSILSLLPTSFGSSGPRKVEELAQELDIDLQLVPIRGWTSKSIKDISRERVILIEGPFSDETSWVTTFINVWKYNDPGRILNSAVFGLDANKRTEEMISHFSTALTVDLAGGLWEVSPVRQCGIDDYINHQPGVVLDTWHLRETRKGFGSVTDKPKEFAITLLRSGQVKFVHFQTRNKSELDDFLLGQGFLFEILQTINRYCPDMTYVIELPPSFLYPKTKENLRRIKDTILNV